MYQYIYQEQADNPTLFILFHGTGGNENDLIPIAKAIDDSANILSLRGDVSEHGALRFFKRKAEGLYDMDDLMERGQALNNFLKKFIQDHQFDSQHVYLIGFSNGANIAINLLLNQANEFSRAILMAPMYPEPLTVTQPHRNQNIFVSMGKEDPIVSIDNSKRVVALFENNGAKVEAFWVPSHQITQESLNAAKSWYQNLNN